MKFKEGIDVCVQEEFSLQFCAYLLLKKFFPDYLDNTEEPADRHKSLTIH